MRNGKLIFVVFFSMFFCGIAGGQGAEGSMFGPLELKPGLEMHGLRIDVMRQDYEEELNDSTSKTEDEEYHVMGFDLGNGLFFDINDNLSFRLDRLLPLNEDHFRVQKIARPKKDKKITEYIFEDEGMHILFPKSRKARYVYSLNSLPQGYESNYKGRFRFSVDTMASNILFRDRTRWSREIFKKSSDIYVLREGRFEEEFVHEGDRVLLGSRYYIAMSEDMQTIDFYTSGWFKDYVLYRIERDADNIYVYTKRHMLFRLELEEGCITEYHGKRMYYRYRN